MENRELLELAAKAAGLELEWRTGWDGTDIPRPMVDCEHWNPFNDDGDALRLAVSLAMEVYHSYDGEWFAYASYPSARGIAYAVQSYGQDPLAATRRAIVRAAAEIGRAMP